MPLPLRRPRVTPTGLVASASSYDRSAVDSGYALRKAMPWQQRSLTYIDLIPELSYSSRFYSRMLRNLRIYPALQLPNGQIEPIEDGLPVEHLSRLRGKDGTMKQVLGNYGRLMFSTGEGNLLGIHIDTPDEQWMFVWLDEIVVEMDGDKSIRQIIWRPVNNGEVREFGPQEARVYRMWTPHPRRSGEPDSPMRSVAEIAEELLSLTAAVRSTATTRTLAGMLLMPTEMLPLPAEPTGDEDEEGDPFVDEMLEHLESQLEDAGSAAASSPWVVWGAYEMLDQIRRIDLHDPQTDYMERELRKEAIERMARGLDFPPEVLEGFSQSNHWAAKQIFDDMWRSHGSGIADQFVGDITEVYQRPYLREVGYPNWENVVTAYDESKVVLPADQSADADAAHDRGEINGAGYRKLKNIPETYKPSKEEHDEWLAIKLKSPAIAGLAAPATGAPGRPADPVETPDDPSDGPPAQGPEGDSGRKTRVVRASLEIGAAEMALARCRELAGIRLKQKEKGAPAVFKDVNGQPNGSIASLLGPDKLELLAVTPNQLVRGGADTLKTLLCEWDYSDVQADAITQMVESYAALTLFKSGHPTLPSGFAAQFERAKEASNVND